MAYPACFLFVLHVLLITAVYGYPDIQRRATGDTKCGNTMCISATVNGSTTNYVLSSRGVQTLGWMAMGFGVQMANTPMVIMWLNSDGSVTLSQRKASSEVMPQVDSNPPRTASFNSDLSVLSSSKPSFSFSIPSNSDQSQSIIYAYGTQKPSSSSVSATLIQHVDASSLQLDLTKDITSSSGTPTGGSYPTSTSSSPGSSSGGIPLKPYQRMAIAHGIFCTLGFLLILPFGVLFARYARTFYGGWFKVHAIFQFFIAGPIIFIGVMLGIAAVGNVGAVHLDDNHKRWGLALFILYMAQCIIGAVIHYYKPKFFKSRPPQNYFHAMFGLLIIGLAFYQVRTGYNTEWPTATGRDPLPSSVDVIFWIWVILLPVAYGVGLWFLRRQFQQERKKNIRPAYAMK